MTSETFRLTQYSHGAGCGCKISPQVLGQILHSTTAYPTDKNLLVGNATRDDAAAYDLGNGQALISTTDFFMPIVDDAFEFGRIASANAISDVYAMGGKPLLAIAILGWPIDKLPPEVAAQIIEGSRALCAEAGIVLAGGHSIDSPEPIFGLAVTGMVPIENLKQNSTATAGCELYLTKPLGIGILTTAQKKGILRDEDSRLGPELMTTLNKPGEAFGQLPQVRAMTDVTGFGLLGHLSEMCEGSCHRAEIDFAKEPNLPVVEYYLEQKSIPGGTHRNWASYGHCVQLTDESQKLILADPQTSGGLLVAVEPSGREEFLNVAREFGLELEMLGVLKEQEEGRKLIEVSK